MPAPERDALAKAIRVAEAAQSLRVCMPDWCPGFFDGQLTQLERELTEALAGVEACRAMGCAAVATVEIATARNALAAANRSCTDCDPSVSMTAALLATWTGWSGQRAAAIQVGGARVALRPSA